MYCTNVTLASSKSLPGHKVGQGPLLYLQYCTPPPSQEGGDRSHVPPSPHTPTTRELSEEERRFQMIRLKPTIPKENHLRKTCVPSVGSQCHHPSSQSVNRVSPGGH